MLSQVKHLLNQSYIYSRLKIPLYIPGSIKTHRIYTRDFIYPASITMKLYDMIQVYSSGSTVIMHMHYIWPVLHMTSYLVAINKNRDMCFDMKNGKKTYFRGEIPVNDCQNVWRGLKSIRLIKKKFFTYLKKFMQRIIQKPILKSICIVLWSLHRLSKMNLWLSSSVYTAWQSQVGEVPYRGGWLVHPVMADNSWKN